MSNSLRCGAILLALASLSSCGNPDSAAIVEISKEVSQTSMMSSLEAGLEQECWFAEAGAFPEYRFGASKPGRGAGARVYELVPVTAGAPKAEIVATTLSSGSAMVQIQALDANSAIPGIEQMKLRLRADVQRYRNGETKLC